MDPVQVRFAEERYQTNHNFKPGTVARAIADHCATDADPITVNVGEQVAIGQKDTQWVGWVWCTDRAGKSGWVPERYIERHGDAGTVLYDYNAIELSVYAGEQLTLHKAESGWFWATNSTGRSGWVPATTIEQ